MAASQQQPASFPPGFVEQVELFFNSQAQDGVKRLVCYDKDQTERLVISLPITDRTQAAVEYRQAWQIWRGGGAVLRVRPQPAAGLPQNEARETLSEMPDFGLEP